jgi:acyl-coenzyme A thioesterase PaaI-like protein
MSEVLEKVLDTAHGNTRLSSELKSHKNIHVNHSYTLLELSEGYAKTSINSQKSESVDGENTIYDGSIFSAANFCAMAAVNEPQTFLISANIDFLNQVSKDDEEVIFEAHASNNLSGKKQIDVQGKINDIVIFKGDFVALKLDNNSIIKTTK